MTFVRFCITEFGLSSSSEFLLKLPQILDSQLPLFYFEQLQDVHRKVQENA